MSSSVDEFENAFQSCITALTSPTANYTHDGEEVKTSADQTVQRFLDSAKGMECFFLQKRLYLSVHRPEQLIKEDIDEIKIEIQRKDAVISKFQEKLQMWQAMLSDQPQAPVGMAGPPVGHPLAPAIPHQIMQQQAASAAAAGMRGPVPHPGQQMLAQQPAAAPPGQPHSHVVPPHVMHQQQLQQQQSAVRIQHPVPPHLSARGQMMQSNFGPNMSPGPHQYGTSQMPPQQLQQAQLQQQPQQLQQQRQQQPPAQVAMQQQQQPSPLAFLERTTSAIGQPDARR